MKKVLILSEAFGSGHTKAAEALVQGISLLDPSIKIQMMEGGRELHPICTSLIIRSYLKMISTCPSLWRKIYHYKHCQPISAWRQFIIYQLFHRKMENLLHQEETHLVISTHPFGSSSLSRLKRLGYRLNLCTVITDFYVHGAWVHPEVDLYLVLSDEVKKQLLDMGIQRNRISITGIPVKPTFWIKNNKIEMRERLKLKNLPTVMIMGGGLGLGGIHSLTDVLIKWKEELQLVICTGFNEILKQNLSQNKMYRHSHIHILGFLESVDEWMDASDLVITKPGGLTCFEALIKGIPILLYKPIPGHEEQNGYYLTKNHLAIRIEHLNEIDDWIKKLLFHPEEFESLREEMRHFQQKTHPLASAESIIQFIHR